MTHIHTIYCGLQMIKLVCNTLRKTSQTTVWNQQKLIVDNFWYIRVAGWNEYIHVLVQSWIQRKKNDKERSKDSQQTAQHRNVFPDFNGKVCTSMQLN